MRDVAAVAESSPRRALPFRYRLVRKSIRFLFGALTRLHMHGVDRLPETGPYIMVTNHIHLFDPPLVFAVLGERDVTGFVGASHRRNLFLRWIVDAVGGIWLRRGDADRAAMKAALAELERGRILGIAPEGTRSRTGGLLPGRTGTAFVSRRAGVPIYPIGLWGTEKIAGAWSRLRRAEVHLVVGDPFELEEIVGESRPQRLQIWTDEIMCRIAALIPLEYRGVYADHPRLQELLAAH